MFDFDELEDAEVPKPEPEPTELPQAASEKVPERVEPEVDASTASPVEEPKEMPNAKYSPGMVLECVGQLLMRQQEDLESPQVARLPQKSLVKVLEVGTGPSGKRVKVHAASGEEGWASVIASNTAPMFRSTERPFALETAPVAVAAVPEAAPVEPAATATVEPVASAPSATVSEMPWSSIRPGDTCVCKTTVVMRRDEDTNSELMWRLPVGEELEILKSGTEPTGRRFMAKDSQGNKGWISAFSKEGNVLLEVTQRGTQSLFVGAGQALGGDDRGPEAAASDRRAAALAAAEKRQAQFMSRGVGEMAAWRAEQREAAQKQAAAEESRPKEVPVAPSAPRAPESRVDFKPPTRSTQSAPQVPFVPPGPTGPAAPLRHGAEKQKEEAARSQGLIGKEIEEVFDLEALGFDFYQALHAFAAHRNKEVAANILLESQEEPVGSQLPVPVQLRPLPPAFSGPQLNESQLGFSALDFQKVQRLMDLGFDRPTAVKALWNCNWDEEAAGNRLLA